MIEVTNLFKAYDKSRVLEGISFNIQNGESVGIIGRNGSGKSTLIKILGGIIKPDSGIVKIDGFDTYKNRIKMLKTAKFVFGQRTQLEWDVPVIDSLRFLGSLYAMKNKDILNTADSLAQTLSATELLQKKCRELSLGQRMICEMIGALINSPRAIILDEPTIGLDEIVKRSLIDLMYNYVQDKKATIFVATHDVEVISRLTKKILLLEGGKISNNVSLDLIKNEKLDKKVTIRLVKGINTDPLVEKYGCLMINEHTMASFDILFPSTSISLNTIFSGINELGGDIAGVSVSDITMADFFVNTMEEDKK
jgi:ABC-2 type transport system ATP-binding protein